MTKKPKQKWTWQQIRKAIKKAYLEDSFKDSWDVPAIYENILAVSLRRNLAPKSITKRTK